MESISWRKQAKGFDERRTIIVPGDETETVLFAVRQFLEIGNQAVRERQFFTVALSGGQTPLAIFKELSKPEYAAALDWTKVLCFWSDERSAPPDNRENNYFSAMESGLNRIPLLPEHIFRMHAEDHIEENALKYSQTIKENVPFSSFDLIMLGMGDDGHTASLFPRTAGLRATGSLAIANFVSQKNTWRMTLTYECIRLAKTTCIYVTGIGKAKTVARVLLGAYDPDNLPVQAIGTTSNKAVWILDSSASTDIASVLAGRA